ncbi:MAG: helix-turn-helix transcriptional regulator [Dehalococcoidales bacterium]|nr:helix-turn-helix transcriptional regulator [Dehalococcoidales bacterium]
MGIILRQGEAEDGGFILNGDIHVTRRELEALLEIAQGRDNEEAARNLGISYTTLRNHTYNVMKKMGAGNRAEAVVKAVENGMLVIRPKKDLVKKPKDDYQVCMYCGRVFFDSPVVVEYEPEIINHVKIQPPDKLKCPYDDCDGCANDAFTWRQIRKFHPEYPETPEKGVVYSVDELINHQYQHYISMMVEYEEAG